MDARTTESPPNSHGGWIPDQFRAFFWDCDFAGLDPENHRSFVTGRILVEGSWDAVRWLRDRIGDAGIREWIVEHEGRGLSPKQLRFWELIAKLPGPLVNCWIESRRHEIWENRVSK